MEAAFAHDKFEIRGLPRRQAEALGLTFLGLNSKETAKKMGISPRTVEMFINNAMNKLGAANRVHLAIEAGTQGVLVLKNAAMCLLVSFLLLFASMPGSNVQSADDLNRAPARNLRVRRRNEGQLTIALPEEDA
jgi:DNA-binding CsgD family transcriptional regulator